MSARCKVQKHDKDATKQWCRRCVDEPAKCNRQSPADSRKVQKVHQMLVQTGKEQVSNPIEVHQSKSKRSVVPEDGPSRAPNGCQEEEGKSQSHYRGAPKFSEQHVEKSKASHRPSPVRPEDE